MNIHEVEKDLREAFAHLFDPGYQPEPGLSQLLSESANDPNIPFQTALMQVVERLKPLEDANTPYRIKQFYQVLQYRFIQQNTLEETALKLHMSVSSAWREQRSAIHFLASLLHQQWESHQKSRDENREDKLNPRFRSTQEQDWEEQTRRELESLYTYDHETVSDVGKLLEGVLGLEKAVAIKHQVELEVGAIQDNLYAAVNPTVFRQILIQAIGFFIRNSLGKRITLFAKLEDGNVIITITGRVQADTISSEDEFVHNHLLPANSTIEVFQDGEQLFWWLRLPHLSQVNVLVVDDNQDMIRFYRRASEGTDYRIIPFEEGQDLIETAHRIAPDIIVLDIMLPGQDGWELLLKLRTDPTTQLISVIVCSVMKEEELALSLGAAAVLSKPILREDFIRALDQVLSQVP